MSEGGLRNTILSVMQIPTITSQPAKTGPFLVSPKIILFWVTSKLDFSKASAKWSLKCAGAADGVRTKVFDHLLQLAEAVCGEQGFLPNMRQTSALECRDALRLLESRPLYPALIGEQMNVNGVGVNVDLQKPVQHIHLFPELLSLYNMKRNRNNGAECVRKHIVETKEGDGNITSLSRATMRSLDTELRSPLSDALRHCCCCCWRNSLFIFHSWILSSASFSFDRSDCRACTNRSRYIF